jgi:hypothetical protein
MMTERLRAVRRGPPITVSCPCGERRRLGHGERWRCERCGRRWNTAQIPRDSYLALRAEQLRYRRAPLAVSVLALACVVTGVLAGRALGGLMIMAVALITWSMFFRPLHRRRHREALARVPTWTLTAETAETAETADDERPAPELSAAPPA